MPVKIVMTKTSRQEVVDQINRFNSILDVLRKNLADKYYVKYSTHNDRARVLAFLESASSELANANASINQMSEYYRKVNF